MLFVNEMLITMKGRGLHRRWRRPKQTCENQEFHCRPLPSVKGVDKSLSSIEREARVERSTSRGKHQSREEQSRDPGSLFHCQKSWLLMNQRHFQRKDQKETWVTQPEEEDEKGE